MDDEGPLLTHEHRPRGCDWIATYSDIHIVLISQIDRRFRRAGGLDVLLAETYKMLVINSFFILCEVLAD
jgi:hypothetical protein